ncbi:MAG: TetR/AcrR family transcriptional regulator [Myxococcales bacterium]|nr:TetR/AcrR family transcriptional regulator [Myxococcales bacterium]
MKRKGRPARRYQSPLRARQAAQTRRSILEALVEQVGRVRPGEYSLAEVAQRAGVSLRTLYRHFGSREALAAALGEVLAERAIPPLPDTPEGLGAYPEALFAVFDAHAPWVEAMLKVGGAHEVRAAGKPRRIAAFRACLGPLLDGLPEEEARRAMAVIKQLISAEAWRAMRNDFGMDGPAAGSAVGWAVKTLLADLRRSRERSCK